MGCCSSKTLSNSVSPVNECAASELQKAVPSLQNTELIDHHRLQQHEDDNHEASESSASELPRIFANNVSIAKEVMRLEEVEMNHTQNDLPDTEKKSKENSEDILESESFGEFTINKANDHKTSIEIEEEEEYHPFGLIQRQKDCVAKEINDDMKESAEEEENENGILDLEALYEENLKQHGFDADKFRTANAIKTTQNNTHHESRSADICSFASSQMSSQKQPSDDISNKENYNKMNLSMNSINEYMMDEAEDFMMEELSRSTVNPMIHPQKKENEDEMYTNIEYLRQYTNEKSAVNDVMDDQDEELMDAILSLDFED